VSHDRGCPCGREKYEYEDCTRTDCFKKVETKSRKLITFEGSNNQILLTFHTDGTVTANKELKPDETAKKVIDLLVKHGWLYYAQKE
jgi:hypothetical protein